MDSLVAVYSLINACVVQCDTMRQMTRKLIMDPACVSICERHSEIHTRHRDGCHTEGFHLGRAKGSACPLLIKVRKTFCMPRGTRVQLFWKQKVGEWARKEATDEESALNTLFQMDPDFAQNVKPANRKPSAAIDTSQRPPSCGCS